MICPLIFGDARRIEWQNPWVWRWHSGDCLRPNRETVNFGANWSCFGEEKVGWRIDQSVDSILLEWRQKADGINKVVSCSRKFNRRRDAIEEGVKSLDVGEFGKLSAGRIHAEVACRFTLFESIYSAVCFIDVKWVNYVACVHSDNLRRVLRWFKSDVENVEPCVKLIMRNGRVECPFRRRWGHERGFGLCNSNKRRSSTRVIINHKECFQAGLNVSNRCHLRLTVVPMCLLDRVCVTGSGSEIQRVWLEVLKLCFAAAKRENSYLALPDIIYRHYFPRWRDESRHLVGATGIQSHDIVLSNQNHSCILVCWLCRRD